MGRRGCEARWEVEATMAIPMDQRDGWIWFDGELKPWKDAKIHVLTHGLHYASSVFEGERAYGGGIFKLRGKNQRVVRPAQTPAMILSLAGGANAGDQRLLP